MRCKGCDYPLWTIRARQCPECGLAFAPSEFDFAINAVEFHCPHCDQPYFGTGERGHLVPPEFDCVSCGTRVTMDEMVLRPGEGVAETQTTPAILPWLDRKKKRTAAWRVIGLAMTQPRRMMDITPVESSIGRAWWFYTLVMLIVSILNGFGFIFIGMVGGGVGAAVLFGLAAYVCGLFGWPLLWGAVAHGLMRLFGAKPRFSIGRTYQALCYSSGVMLPAAIPCVGFYLVPVTTIWWMISAALAIGRAQRARAGRAALAVVLLPALLYVGAVGTIAYGIFFSFRAMGSFSFGRIYAQQLYGALSTPAIASGGAWPAHGATLLADGSVPWYNLTLPSGIDQTPQSLGGLAPWQWDGSAATTAQERADVASAMAAALDPNWAAHRLGYVVFTYNGISPTVPQDPGLWVLFYWPDPADGSAWITGATGVAMRADGTTEDFDPGAFAGALSAQNALRQQHALPPIPDPDTILEVTPAPGVGGP